MQVLELPLPDDSQSWTQSADCQTSQRGACIPVKVGGRDLLVLGSQDRPRGLQCKCETQWR
eukprot:3117117-Prorocentrum_lima.AAC.1